MLLSLIVLIHLQSRDMVPGISAQNYVRSGETKLELHDEAGLWEIFPNGTSQIYKKNILVFTQT